MTVQELMTPFPATCGPADNLAQAAEHMWDADCGIVPVVDERGHVLGVITDRDICIAAATRGRAPAEIAAGDMVHGHTVVVRETELVTTALALATGILPPTINLRRQDPDCDLDVIPNHARRGEVEAALCNCLGFGSKNSALVLGRA